MPTSVNLVSNLCKSLVETPATRPPNHCVSSQLRGLSAHQRTRSTPLSSCLLSGIHRAAKLASPVQQGLHLPEQLDSVGTIPQSDFTIP
jgi:hypothetical protein